MRNVIRIVINAVLEGDSKIKNIESKNKMIVIIIIIIFKKLSQKEFGNITKSQHHMKSNLLHILLIELRHGLAWFECHML